MNNIMQVRILVKRFDPSDLPTLAIDWPKWIENEISKVPEEYRSVVRIDTESDWDSSAVTFEMFYRRPETAEEAAIREGQAASRKMAEELRERKLFERLKAKYDK